MLFKLVNILVNFLLVSKKLNYKNGSNFLLSFSLLITIILIFNPFKLFKTCYHISVKTRIKIFEKFKKDLKNLNSK